MEAADNAHSFALSLNKEAILLAFDDYQGLLKRYARVPEWQKPVPRDSFTPGESLLTMLLQETKPCSHHPLCSSYPYQ